MVQHQHDLMDAPGRFAAWFAFFPNIGPFARDPRESRLQSGLWRRFDGCFNASSGIESVIADRLSIQRITSLIHQVMSRKLGQLGHLKQWIHENGLAEEHSQRV